MNSIFSPRLFRIAQTKYLPRLSEQSELNICLGYPKQSRTEIFVPRLSEQPRTKYFPRLSEEYELNICLLGYPRLKDTNPRLSKQYELNICHRLSEQQKLKYLPRLSQQYELNSSIGYRNSRNKNICLRYPNSTNQIVA